MFDRDHKNAIMKTITLFEYSSPKRKDLEHLFKIERKLEKINKIARAKVLERTFNTIKATNYVGVFSVGDTVIQILPKLYKPDTESGEKRIDIATRNLLFMLTFTKKLKIKEVGISKLKKESSNLYEAIVYLFAKNLLETLKVNYTRDYERQEEDLRFVKGKIMLSKQFRKPIHDKIHCSYFELSENTLINRILKYTCHLLSSKVKSRENWILLHNILSIYDGVELTPIRLSDFDKVRFNRLNEDYEPFISLARLFLENMSLELQSSQFKTFSLIFDMNVLFEEFLGEFLKRHQKELLEDTDFKDCNIHFQKKRGWLIEQPKSFQLIPDITLSENEEIKLIIDTKYKILDSNKPHCGVSQDDVYQMFAYSKKFNCSKIVLLYPWNERVRHVNGTGVVKTYKFDKQTELYIATVNLMRDLRKKSEFDRLKKELRELFSKLGEDLEFDVDERCLQ